MKKSDNTFSSQAKTHILALSTLFLASSLYAQPLSQTPTAAPQETETAPCPMQKTDDLSSPHGKHCHHRKHGIPEINEVLGKFQLTEEQQKQLDQIADKLAQKRLPLMEQIRGVQIKLNEQAYLPQLDTATITLLQEQRNKLWQDISTLNDNARLQALALLSPEQRKQLGEQWKQCHSPIHAKKDKPEPPRHHGQSLLFPSGPMMP